MYFSALHNLLHQCFAVGVRVHVRVFVVLRQTWKGSESDRMLLELELELDLDSSWVLLERCEET
jgi:hypothetical protein